MARSFDMGATLQQYNRSETGEAADTKALSGDWKSVGQDMSDALDNYGQKPA